MASRAAQYRALLGTVLGTWTYWRTKLGRRPIEVTLPNAPDTLLVRPNTSDRRTFHKIFLDHEYGVPVDGQPRLIIDAGANVGYASVYFARRFPAAKIIAIEPDSANFALLTRNARAYESVAPRKQGVWTHPAKLAIENPDDASWAFRVVEVPPDQAGIEATSLIEVLAGSGLDRIDILKLDVEGTERELFAAPDAEQWLSRTDLLLVELHERFKPGTEAIFDAAMKRHGFEVTRVGENYVARR